MSDKKHIDRIFQEKLKDFEATPSPKVWQQIQKEIEQPNKETKKAYPIWMRLAGVAALLLLLLTIGNTFISNPDKNVNNKVVDTKSAEKNPSINSDNESIKNTNLIEDNVTTSKEDIIANTNTLEVNTENNLQESNSENPVSENNEANEIVEINTSERKATVNTNHSVSNKTVINKPFSNKKTNYRNSTANVEKSPSNIVPKKETPIYSNSKRVTSNNSNLENKTTSEYTSGTINKKPISTGEVIAQNNSEKRNKESIAQLDKEKVDKVLNNKTSDAVVDGQANSTEEKNETKTEEEAEKEALSIEEEIAQAENINEEEKEEEKVNRWQVYANIAPVYYNTLGKGSHIDEQFNNSSKSGEINASYGVNVSYAFNDKLKLRSGIHSLKLSYDTDDVILFENVSTNTGGNGPALRNVSLNATGQNISAISSSSLTAQQAVGLLPNENAAISQRLGYYEVPLELEYTVVNKKFGVNVIGGVSTFILNDNKVYSEYDGYNTHIGEANNINDVSFSGNLGLGLDYKFSDKVKFNVQPTFKYQLNAYKNTSGSFRPYIVGVYTGLSYKF